MRSSMALVVRRLIIEALFLAVVCGLGSADCLSPYGYSFSVSGSLNITQINVGNVSFINASLSNFNCSNELGIAAAGKLNINTTAGRTAITCYVYDSRSVISHGTNTSTPSIVFNLTDSNFTRASDVYNVSFKFEDNGSSWNFPGGVAQTLNVMCPDYTTASINLLNFNRSLLLTTRQRPIFEVRVGSVFIRQVTMLSDVANLDYLIPSGYGSTVAETFTLTDQTGGWLDSVVELSTTLNDESKVVDSRKWSNDMTVPNVFLVANNEYQVVLRKDSNNQDKGRYTFPSNATRAVYVTQGIISYPDLSFPGLSYNMWGNFSTGSVYAYYAVSPGSVSLAELDVSECSASLDCRSIIYSTSSGANSSLFVFPVPNASLTYALNLRVLYSGGFFNKTQNVELVSSSTSILGGPMPSGTLFGFDWRTIISSVGLLVVLWTAAMAHQLNLSFVAVGVSFEVMFLNYFGLFWPPLPNLLVLSVFVLALLLRVHAARKGYG